jgi:predicted HAD superfamily hydrolase
MKRYIVASKKSNLELLKSFAGQDTWVLANILNYYSGKVLKRALIKINKIRGDVYYNMIPLQYDYANVYDNALSFALDYEYPFDKTLDKEYSTLKDCIQIVEPIESYTTSQIRDAFNSMT